MARKKKSYGEWIKENYGAAVNDYADAVQAMREANDIAPVAPSPLQEKKEDDSWLKAGAFDDGYQFGDLTASLFSTVGDVASGAAQGFLSLGEGVLDLGTHALSGVTGLFGWEDGSKWLKDAAQYGIVENAFNPIDDLFDDNSFLGSKTEGIEEGLGQVAAIMLSGGLASTSAGATAITTGLTGASSMGSGINEAYAGGATDAEAWGYGAMSGVVNAGTELLFGGLGKTVKALGVSKGIGGIDDMFAKKLSSAISNTVAKNLVQFGVKSAGEGFEEYLAYYGEAVAKKLSYMSEKEWSEIANNDEALEAFVVGTITSSISQSGVVPGMKNGSLIETTKSGEDFVTNLTENEQKVVDMEVAKRVDEKEKRSGKELSKKEKNAIYDQVVEDLDNGAISIDTIEEVLGGDSYKAYTDLQSEADEFKTLYETEGGKLSEKQRDRLAELKAKNQATPYESLLKAEGEKLSQSAFDAVKGDRNGKGSRLVSSYAEVSKRGKAFEADVNSYDEKYRATVQRAIDSGILNNSRRTHEFVEILAKIEADKGVKFDFLNNEKLKGTSFARDDAFVNGYYDSKSKTIGVNIDSAKAWQTTVGHEVTHVLEGTELYGDLQKALFEYAEAKGELKSRREALSQHYKEADIDSELVADLVGDYLFTDEAFIKHLSAKNRNVFQKIFDEIKYLCKIATAGSKEKRQLEEIKHLFEQVYKADVKTDAKTDSKVQHSVSNKNPLDKYRKNSYNLYNAIYEYGQPFPYKLPSDFPRRLANKTTGMVDGEIRTIYVCGYIFEADGYMHGRILAPYNTKTKNLLEVVKNEHDRIDEDTEVASIWAETTQDAERGSGGDSGVSRRGRSSADDRLLGASPERHSSGDNERVRQTLETKAEIDEIVKKLREMMGLDAKTSSETLEQTQSNEIAPTKASSEDGVFFDAENTKFSLSPEQQKADTDYLAAVERGDTETARNMVYEAADKALSQSKITDKHFRHFGGGTDELLICYHATDGKFTVFDKDKIGSGSGYNFGKGFYFSTQRNYVKEYGGNVGEYFLDIRNPFNYDTVSKAYIVDMLEKSGYEYDKDFADSYDEEDLWDADLIDDFLYDALKGKNPYHEFSQMLQNAGFDGINVGDGDEIIAFNPNQIKSADPITYDDKGNVIPLSQRFNVENDDIRYSLSSMASTFFGDENMSALAFKEADYTKTQGYRDYVEKCVNNMRQTRTDFDEATARKQIEDSIDGIVRVALAAKQAGYDIYDDASKRDKKDSKNRLLFSSLEPNSDYFTSNDISTICDKRQNFAQIYDDIVRAEEAKGVPRGKRFFDNVDNYFYLHKLMADKGLTQPCRQCYVESMRKNLAPMANAFLRLVGETDPNNTANDQLYEQKGKNKGNLKSNNAATREWVLEKLSEYGMTAADLSVETLTTEDGLAQLKIQAPLIYEAFNSFYGQSKPKMPKSATPFRFGELTALLTDNKGKIKQGLVDKINSTGGFRLQSYSDFQIQNYTDVLQVIFEAGTLGLNGHAYTKVPAFLEATEGTNLKRNISIFMYKDGGEWKLDRNDSFPYTLEEIYDIVNGDKSGNTSIIAVSQNNEMSAWIMANDLVGYGIPFHKSGMKMGTVRDTDVKTEDGRIVKGYADTKDHTKQQTEAWATTTVDHKAYTKVKKGINIYGEEVGWDFENKDNLSKNELIEKNIKAYIDACENAGYIPKFRDYVMNNGKVLTDVLKYAKELGFASPDATIADISFEYKGYTIPYGYYKFLGDFGMFTPDGQTAPQKPLSLENYDFDKAVEFFGNSEELHRNEILQQFANGKEREIYRNSDLTAEQLTEIIKQRRTEIADSVVSGQASLSPIGETPTQYGDFYTPANEMSLEAPIAEDIAPVTKVADTAIDEDEWVSKDIAPVANTGIIPNETRVYAGDRGNVGTVKGYNEEKNEYSVFFRAKNGNTATVNISADEISPLVENKTDEELGEEAKVARVLEDEPEVPKEERKILNKIRANFVDKGSVVEDLALKSGNRELDAKYNFMHYSESRAQSYIAKHLKPIVDSVAQTGKQNEFETYAYHLHNIDRMSLESKAQERIAELKGKFGLLRLDQIKAIAATKITEKTTERTAQTIREAKEYLNALETKNKPVYGDSVTADVSREEVKRLEAENPEFKELVKAYTEYNNALRKMLVDGGVISQQTADLWAKMYPHYMPIRRDGKSKLGITVPLDTNKTGVNAPVKGATGGNSDILPLSNTMAIRTEQTFKAIARNSFGIELMHTLDSVVDSESASVDEVMDGFENHEELLKEGKNGQNPTFTVFENGKRVTFEISADMYDALKPTSKGLAYTNKVLNKVNNIRRGLITEFNPAFMLTNPIKDAQDVLMNSQHAAKTYAAFPKAIKELWTKGKWYTEYMEHGGEDNTYFDGKTNKFAEEATGIKKLIGIPLNKISDANNFIERIPRLAEYIASRESGASVESAMLDAARVTTNFAAGGDVTKFANRNGFTFLNASVQGAAQQVRNLREAKAQGFKGWVKLAAKVAVAGLPAVLLNHLLWGDDEEYEELSDYVKDNYYVVAKYGDGQFVRLPKGRTLAVIQDAFEQMGNMLTGNDEVDLANFLQLAIDNLAPNNPLDNNLIAPIGQAMSNKTWYGEDLVPTRLQDLPEAEQFDESTDALSKWLGETLNISPYKINYVLDQYSGALGDIFLPMWTPESDGGGILAPLTDKFTTDSVLNNQNVSDFYDKMDELTKKANSMYATDEDVLAYKYMSTINSELGELYGQKREIQNSDLSDSAKDAAIRGLQAQINSLARNGLSSYGNATNGGSAVVGDKLYGEYSLAKAMGGYKAYKSYSSALYDIKGDKNKNGVTISGSRKKKVIEYINSLDADYGTKILLLKKEYPSVNKYNMDIIEYLNSREDISYKEMEAILKELGFTVRADGSIAWN